VEPNENRQLVLRKAINAHEEAIAALNDLTGSQSDDRFSRMLERVTQNLKELHRDADSSSPEDIL